MKKVFVVLIIGVLFVAGVLFATAKPTTQESLQTQDPRDNVGKHAYNKTSGVYQGQILDVKHCQTYQSETCYLTDIPSYAKPKEHPIDNVEVRDEAPSPSALP